MKAAVFSGIALMLLIVIFIFSFKPVIHKPYRIIDALEQIGLEKNEGLTVVTFNIWMPHVWIPKNEKRKRLKILPDYLKNTNADILCLQEVFDPTVKKLLMRSLENSYKVIDDSCETSSLMFWQKDCQGGLVTLSKFPVFSQSFYAYPTFNNMKLDEKIGEKGVLMTRIKIGDAFGLIINTHLYAGRSEEDSKLRLKQIKFLIGKVKQDSLSENDRFILLCGDLNLTHPAIQKENATPNTDFEAFRLLEAAGFINPYDQIPVGFTYDPEKNPYANLWYNRPEKKQILDYILIRTQNHSRLEISSHEVIFDENLILSDHFGIRLKFKVH